MRLIFFIPVLASLILSSSCFQRDASPATTDYFNDSSYSKVVLLQLDSTFYHCYDMDSLQDNAGMKAIDDGIGFIDSAGTILSDKIIRKQLSPLHVTRLKQLIHQQKGNETYLPNTCVAVYRTALLFLDTNDDYVSHANIPMYCGRIIIHPSSKDKKQFDYLLPNTQLKQLLLENGVDTLVDGPPPNPVLKK